MSWSFQLDYCFASFLNVRKADFVSVAQCANHLNWLEADFFRDHLVTAKVQVGFTQ